MRITIMSERKIMVGLPLYAGNLKPEFMKSYIRARSKGFFHRETMPNGDSLVTRARNNITHSFLESDCTHLLFLDDDLEFHSDHIAMLLENDKGIVCGMYPKKQLKLQPVLSRLPEGQGEQEGHLITVREAGTGFMMISRQVFEAIMSLEPENHYIDDNDKSLRYDFWKVGVFKDDGDEYGRYLSEDWYFCWKARQLGFKTWVDTRILVAHIGQYSYPLEQSELKELNEHYNKIQGVADEMAREDNS